MEPGRLGFNVSTGVNLDSPQNYVNFLLSRPPRIGVPFGIKGVFGELHGFNAAPVALTAHHSASNHSSRLVTVLLVLVLFLVLIFIRTITTESLSHWTIEPIKLVRLRANPISKSFVLILRRRTDRALRKLAPE